MDQVSLNKYQIAQLYKIAENMSGDDEIIVKETHFPGVKFTNEDGSISRHCTIVEISGKTAPLFYMDDNAGDEVKLPFGSPDLSFLTIRSK